MFLNDLVQRTELTEKQIDLQIIPSNEGPLAVMGTAPVLKVGRLFGYFDTSIIDIQIDPNSLVVQSTFLSEADKTWMLSKIRDELFETDQFSSITFQGSLPVSIDVKEFKIEGRLTLHGITQSLSLNARRMSSQEYVLETQFLQTDFGMRPLSAFLGALSSKDLVKIRININLS